MKRFWSAVLFWTFTITVLILVLGCAPSASLYVKCQRVMSMAQTPADTAFAESLLIGGALGLKCGTVLKEAGRWGSPNR